MQPEFDPDSKAELRPNRKDLPPPKRSTEIKPWRRAKLMVPAVAIAAAGLGIGFAASSSPEPYSGGPTATYSAQEIPGQPNHFSVEDTFNTLAKDPNIHENGRSIDINSIAEQFKPTDYDSSSSHSVPVMEVRFDKATDQFIYQVQTPKGLNNKELYQLLLPVTQNSVLLKAAFENDDVTRIAFSLQSPNLPGILPDWTFNDDYVRDDTSDPKEGVQKTVFVTLPGVRSIDTQEVRDTIRHESIHGLTGTNNMSDFKEGTPNSEELAKWNGICTDIRDLSLREAEQHKQSSIENLIQLKNQFHNSEATEVINDIISALQNGTFDRYQPQQGENPNEAFSGKVTDCVTIGPWETFIRLMDSRGLGSFINNVETSNRTISGISQTLQTNWDNMISNQTFYRIFREGTYEQDSPEKLLGHEYADWDELITSTSDACIAYPEQVGQMIKTLPPDQRATALQLVQLSLTTLNEQIPPDKNEDFHNLIFYTLKTVIAQVSASS